MTSSAARSTTCASDWRRPPRRAPRAEQRRLASGLLAFVEDEELRVAPDPVDRFGGLRARWRARGDRWLGGRGLRIVLIGALAGHRDRARSWRWSAIGFGVRFDFSQLPTAFTRFQLVPPRGRGGRRRPARGRRRADHRRRPPSARVDARLLRAAGGPDPGRPHLVLHAPVRLDRGRASGTLCCSAP